MAECTPETFSITKIYKKKLKLRILDGHNFCGFNINEQTDTQCYVVQNKTY